MHWNTFPCKYCTDAHFCDIILHFAETGARQKMHLYTSKLCLSFFLFHIVISVELFKTIAVQRKEGNGQGMHDAGSFLSSTLVLWYCDIIMLLWLWGAFSLGWGKVGSFQPPEFYSFCNFHFHPFLSGALSWQSLPVDKFCWGAYLWPSWHSRFTCGHSKSNDVSTMSGSILP